MSTETLTHERLPEQPNIYDRERRLYDDTTTWLAEVMAGHMRTEFEFSYDGHELFGEDGSSLGVIFSDAQKNAENLSSELAFEKRRTNHESEEYQEMLAMMDDNADFNTIVVVSDFPEELMRATKDIGGYNITRKQTMLRVITKTPQGTIRMQSQSLDLSDRRPLESIYHTLGFEPEEGELLGQRMHLLLEGEVEQEFLIDRLTGVYDQSLSTQRGGDWYAGRPLPKKVNTYDFVCTQKDLLGVYVKNAQVFGDNPNLLHNIAATMAERYEIFNDKNRGKANGHTTLVQNYVLNEQQLMHDIENAGRRAVENNKTFSGCGFSVGGDTSDQLSELGYTGMSDEDEYGSLTFECPDGHRNRRRKGQLLDKCQRKGCTASVKC